MSAKRIFTPILLSLASLSLASLCMAAPGPAQAPVPASAPSSGGASGPRDVVAIARDILADPTYQKELSGRGGDVRRQDSSRGRTRERRDRDRRPRPAPPVRDASASDGGLTFLQMLGILVLALFVAWALVGLIAAVKERRERATPAGSQGPDPGDVPDGAASLSPFEELAAAGRFAEAVHVMLLTVIEHHRVVSRRPVSASATGRELLRRLPRTEEERAGLKRLVAAVELSLFGGRPVSESAYRSCLGVFRGLVA